MKNFFKPEDFEGSDDFEGFTFKDIREKASDIANEKLNALIESMPVVTGLTLSNGHLAYSSEDFDFHTHKARLAFVEEIVKEPCKHEPELHFNGESDQTSFVPKCKHCGVELVAEWKAK